MSNSLTYIRCYVILLLSGGDIIYGLILITFSILFSYNFISIYFISKKSKYINSDNIIHKFSSKFYPKYFNSINKTLFNLSYPYGINIKKYLSIKYFISTIISITIFIRDKNAITSLIIFGIFYFLPNVIIYIFKKTEELKIVNEISNIVQSLILSLSANMSFYEALKISINSINYIRLKNEYTKFVENYSMYNFNINKALEDFIEKFNSYEFNMFVAILVECEKEGNLVENLEAFQETLEFVNFKYLRLKSANRIVFVSISTVISLINIFLIVFYPISTQISNNLIYIFK